ncbi:MAG TPA: endonuclease/exonuclease/phosphatase family protein [Chloroflexota bacterium]
MTYNIWNYSQQWAQRRPLIAQLIKEQNPDVVALQETRHDFRYERGRGQGEQLADLTGYHATSIVAQVYVPLPRVDEGLTVLTRQPPEDVVSRELTLLKHERHDENHRACLGVKLDGENGPVFVFDAHFSLSPVARLSNAREAAAFIQEVARDRPAFLMGDLNAEPHEESIASLLGGDDLFLDCWTALHEDDPGYTYASFGAVRRIDYVLARNLSGLPHDAHVVGGKAHDGVFPSDHMAIVLDVLV